MSRLRQSLRLREVLHDLLNDALHAVFIQLQVEILFVRQIGRSGRKKINVSRTAGENRFPLIPAVHIIPSPVIPKDQVQLAAPVCVQRCLPGLVLIEKLSCLRITVKEDSMLPVNLLQPIGDLFKQLDIRRICRSVLTGKRIVVRIRYADQEFFRAPGTKILLDHPAGGSRVVKNDFFYAAVIWAPPGFSLVLDSLRTFVCLGFKSPNEVLTEYLREHPESRRI